MKNNNGITMMSLVITIVVMVIMISVVGYYSIESIENSHISDEKRELDNVLEYMALLKTKLLVDEFSLSDSTVLEQDVLSTFNNILTETQINNISEVNLSTLDSKYKYHYVTPEMLSDKSFSDEIAVVKDAKNDYIINFYTGTVIALYDSKCDISGGVWGMNDVLLYINDYS